MSGAVPPLPHVPSWRDLNVSTGTALPVTMYKNIAVCCNYQTDDASNKTDQNYCFLLSCMNVGRVAQSVQRLTTGWTVRGSNPGGARFSTPVQTGHRAHAPSCTMGTGSFPGVKCGWGVLLTIHPLLMPRSWKSRAIPLPTLWATPGL
jgi:hypothetical protein